MEGDPGPRLPQSAATRIRTGPRDSARLRLGSVPDVGAPGAAWAIDSPPGHLISHGASATGTDVPVNEGPPPEALIATRRAALAAPHRDQPSEPADDRVGKHEDHQGGRPEHPPGHPARVQRRCEAPEERS